MTALGFNAHGGHGCISVTSNVAPRLCAQFQNACQQGNYAEALVLQDKLVPLHKTLFLENNPGGVKYAAAKLGLCRNEFRLPLVADQQGQRTGDRRRLVACGAAAQLRADACVGPTSKSHGKSPTSPQ